MDHDAVESVAAVENSYGTGMNDNEQQTSALEVHVVQRNRDFTQPEVEQAETSSGDTRAEVGKREIKSKAKVEQSEKQNEGGEEDSDTDGDHSKRHTLRGFGCNSEFISAAQRAAEQAEEFLLRIWKRGWDVVAQSRLPSWLRDNEFLLSGHRPELHSYRACVKSVFRLHTETGNIWTHLLGALAFIGVAVFFFSRPSNEVTLQEKSVFGVFFAGAIGCLGFSCSFHTFSCHSKKVAKTFAKLDYCGIALLIMASFVPWLFYSFHCEPVVRLIYLVAVIFLGIACIIVSLWDRFASPKLRPLRAGLFIGFGLSGVAPAMHITICNGFMFALEHMAIGWMSLMAVLYIGGALIYAFRIPERLRPGKFDIWGQSHQIFHIFVIAAAFVHYHGISAVAVYRLSIGDCTDATLATEIDALAD